MGNRNYIEAAQYEPRTACSVQGSFKLGNTVQNIAVSGTTAASTAMDTELVLLSMNDYTYVEVGAVATTSSAMLPPGMTALKVTKGDTLNFLQVSAASIASIISPV